MNNDKVLIIDVNRNPYSDVAIYRSDRLKLNPGLSVLTGCNGSGKSTLISMIRDQCQERNIDIMSYNNVIDGQNMARQIALDFGDMSGLCSRVTASEGEEISINIGDFIGRLGAKVRGSSSGSDLVVCFDASDSGVSIDFVVHFKKGFNELIIPDANAHGITLYVVVSANEFEMCDGSDCIDVQTLSHVTFNDYKDYKDFILKSYDKKIARYDKINKARLSNA